MTLYDLPIADLDGRPTDLSDYAGKALLLVNVASQCGLTPQYAGLQQLHDWIKAKSNPDDFARWKAQASRN